ncbi:uncharacterized protein MELLADRAFT_104660 [Melampsora larici-populina 98AG31]|uniref:Uncharacterized protein n=1 Tax=Melampsora larici-populina (strain 98AG31 / pathotype 3-4-7) TaxID=747676 RepID=F4RFH3_MELLP|nr:uncharacterized protein MELLADRAFT_104660 [Melampsora larici-populina 98AG31]EGG08929.1 hypothetical protein MELLADRAFT_104660 [Melampsora larici-populina 98AG31]
MIRTAFYDYRTMVRLVLSGNISRWALLVLLAVTIPAIPTTIHQYLIQCFTFRLPTVSHLYCAYIGGPYFCGPKDSSRSKKVALLSNTVTSTARSAGDIFESILDLGNPNHVRLYQDEILELSQTIAASDILGKKEHLAESVQNLSEMTRDVRDRVNLLNSASISVLRKVFQKLEVIGLILNSIAGGGDVYSTTSAQARLTDLVQTISNGFSELEAQVDAAIPLARQGSNFAATVGAQFAQQNMQLRKLKAGVPLWKRLVNFNTWESQSLNRNIAMTTASASTLRSIALKLEDLRATLVTFQGNAEHFRSEVIGNHKSCRELAIDDEFRAMSQVIGRFSQLTEAAGTSLKVTRVDSPTLSA